MKPIAMPDQTIHFGIVFNRLNAIDISTVHTIPGVDIALVKLENFNPDNIQTYPKIKDPTTPMLNGTSLCKLGFPFNSITPTFQNGGFVLPPDSLPIPLFPLEGIYTRRVNIVVQNPPGYPLSYIETSSPGLMGQSGGPTFDTFGNVWAIQSITQHLKLGFGESVTPGKETDQLKNQYLNVGWGVHSETIIGLLRQHNISFELS